MKDGKRSTSTAQRWTTRTRTSRSRRSERQHNSPRDNFGPVEVPAGKFFVMGDNRDRSYDSRFWGFVTLDQIEGRAMFIYWSWDGDSQSFLRIRWSRFGMASVSAEEGECSGGG